MGLGVCIRQPIVVVSVGYSPAHERKPLSLVCLNRYTQIWMLVQARGRMATSNATARVVVQLRMRATCRTVYRGASALIGRLG